MKLPEIKTESDLREAIFLLSLLFIFFGLAMCFPEKPGVALTTCGGILLFVSLFRRSA